MRMLHEEAGGEERRARPGRPPALWAPVVAALLAACVGLGAGPGSQSPAEVATDVSANIMSPFCPGLTLHDCPSGAAVALRSRIERWARKGLERDAIMARLEDQFGPQIAATPPAEAGGWLAWGLPLLALAGGAIAAGVLARRWSAGRAEASQRPRLSSEERGRLDAELADLRGPR